MFKGFKRGSDKERVRKGRSGSNASTLSYLAASNASKPNSPPKSGSPKPTLEDFGIWMGTDPPKEDTKEKPSEDSESEASAVNSVSLMPDFLKSPEELAAEEKERVRREEERRIAKEQAEKQRIERERLEKERQEKAKLEKKRLEKEKEKQEKLQKEKEALEKEKKAIEKEEEEPIKVAESETIEPPFFTDIDPFVYIPRVLCPIEKIDLTYLLAKANYVQDQPSQQQPFIKFNSQSALYPSSNLSGSTSQDTIDELATSKTAFTFDNEPIPIEVQEEQSAVPIVPPMTPVCTDPFQEIACTIFETADVYQDGLLDYREFSLVCNSKTLNLDLYPEEIQGIMEDTDADMDGYITYHDFVPIVREFLSHIYCKLDNSSSTWIELKWDGGTRVYFNKRSGEFSFTPPIEHKIVLKHDLEEDVFESTLAELFRVTDKDRKGYINLEQFYKIIKSETLDIKLKQEDEGEIVRFFQYAENNHASINQFTLMARRIIHLISKVRSVADNEWCQLNSNKSGTFWLNKRTMEVTTELPYEFHKRKVQKLEEEMIESALVKQTRKDLKQTFEQLSKLIAENRDLMDNYSNLEDVCEEKQHDLRILTTQLTTIRAVLQAKESALEETSESLKKAEREIEKLDREVVMKNDMKRDLSSTKAALKEAKTYSSDCDKKINQLKKELREANLQLKDAQIEIEHRDRQMGTMSKQLASYKDKTEALEKEVAIIPDLQRRLTEAEEELQRLRSKYEEKATQLILCRKNLKDFRAKIEILNHELERYPSVCQELDEAKMEVASLKRLITAKNNLVQQQFRELDLAKSRLDQVEKSEVKKNNILLNVLERTSRYQNNAPPQDRSSPSPTGRRPTSAPQSPRSGNELGLEDEQLQQFNQSDDLLNKRTLNAMDNAFKNISSIGNNVEGRGFNNWSPEIITHNNKFNNNYSSWNTKQPIGNILQPVDRIDDEYELNQLSRSFAGNIKYKRSGDGEEDDEYRGSPISKNINAVASLAMNKGLSSSLSAMNAEPKFVHMVKIGDRVSARCYIKDEKVDREEIVTGIVKYVGKLDSAYIDNRIYVGLKLDRPVGDSDGVVNGKRYFKSPPNHGKVVRLYDIISVLHPKHIKPLNFQEYMSPRVELAK